MMNDFSTRNKLTRPALGRAEWPQALFWSIHVRSLVHSFLFHNSRLRIIVRLGPTRPRRYSAAVMSSTTVTLATRRSRFAFRAARGRTCAQWLSRSGAKCMRPCEQWTVTEVRRGEHASDDDDVGTEDRGAFTIRSLHVHLIWCLHKADGPCVQSALHCTLPIAIALIFSMLALVHLTLRTCCV